MTQRTSLATFRRSIPALALSLALFACSDDKNNGGNNDKIEGNSLLLNFTRNRDTGELRWMHPDSANLSNGALAFEQDSRVSVAKENIFVLSNLTGAPGTLACILPQDIGDESKIMQNTLTGANPYEAAVIGSKGYIALYEKNYVEVFNVSTCAPSEKIDLPTLEEDAPANASTIKASGDTLLLTLQRLENWAATKPGLLVRINAKTKTLIDTIQLKLYNPSASVLSNGKLYVSAQSRYNADYSYDYTKSGVEVVDLKTKNSEVLATGEQLGGGAYSIALDEANQILYVSTSASWGSSPVKPVNLATKSVGNTLPDILDASDLIFDKEGKKLFVAEKSGLKVYNPATKKTTTIGNQDELLPPSSLAIVNF